MRRITILIVAMLALVAAGCAEETQPVTQPTPPPFDTLEAGTLVVGSDIPYKPFEFEDAGDFTGFDIDLIRAVAAQLGLQLEVKDSNFDTIFTSLAAGKFDVVGSAVTAYASPGSPAEETVTDRRGIVDFTIAYYDSLQSLAVNTEETPDLTSTDGLAAGDRVAVQRATTGESWARANLETKGIEIVDFVEAPGMFAALEGGQVKGVINDLPVSLEAVAGKPALGVVQQIDTGEQYAFAVNKENPGLRDAIDGALRALFADGTYARLFGQYFPDQELPSYASE